MTNYLEMKYISKHRIYAVTVEETSITFKELTNLYIEAKIGVTEEVAPTLFRERSEKYANIKCGPIFIINIEDLSELEDTSGIISLSKIEDGIEVDVVNFENQMEFEKDFQDRIFQRFDLREKIDLYIKANILWFDSEKKFIDISSTLSSKQENINVVSDKDTIVLHAGQPLSFGKVINDLEEKRLISYFSERNVSPKWKLKNDNDGWYVNVKRKQAKEWETKRIGTNRDSLSRRGSGIIISSSNATKNVIAPGDLNNLDRYITGLNKKDFVITPLLDGSLLLTIRRDDKKIKNENWDFEIKDGTFNFEIIADFFMEDDYEAKYSEKTNSIYFEYDQRAIRFSDHLPPDINENNYVEIKDNNIYEIYTVLKSEIVSSKLLIDVIKKIKTS